MDTRHLRQLLAVREHGSLAKAAEALGLSQPHLSRSMARLEDRMRVVLFYRTPTGSELTPIGEMVAEGASRLVKDSENLVLQASMLARGEAGAVRIGVGSALRRGFLPRLLEHIVKRHPRLSLHVEVSSAESLIKKLPKGEIDIAFCAQRTDVIGGDLVFQPILESEFVCAASPAHPLAGKRSIKAGEIAAYPSCGIRGRYFGVPSLPEGGEPGLGAVTYTTTDLDAAVLMTAAPSVVLVGPYFALDSAIRSGVLIPLDFTAIPPAPFAAVTTRSANYSPILQKIVAYGAIIGEQMASERRLNALAGASEKELAQAS